MRRRTASIAFAVALIGLAGTAWAHEELPIAGNDLVASAPAPADAGSPLDQHSDNMSLVANFDDGGTYRLGADEAFWRNKAILSSYDKPGGFRVLDVSDPSRPRELGTFECPGPQNDVSVWRDLVFVSVDSPRESTRCGAGLDPAGSLAGTAFEGIRIVSIANPKRPKQIATVYTDCGSHTHTLVPDLANDRLLIYVESYPLSPTGLGANCNHATHGKISVVEVPLDEPRSAQVIATPSVLPAIGCHDVTAYPAIGLAAAACITESQIWDISDPAHPEILSHIYNPAINIHHSTTFSWDGNTAVIGDELAGAEASPGCPVGDEHMPLGALWFYDVSDPANPAVKGVFHIPQQQADSLLCTAHNFNTVPLESDRDLLVSGWYNGGTTVVDFTDPADPTQLGYYIARGPTQNRTEPVRSTSWSSYWYDGFIYANNFDEDVNSITEKSRGLDVFAIDDPALAGAIDVDHLNAQTMELPGQRSR